MISFYQILKWKGFPVHQAQEQLTHFYSLSQDKKKIWIESRRQKIVEYHITHNPLYRNLTNGVSASWNELPILHKKDYQSPVREMLSDPFGIKDVYISNTSGSSGHPFFFAKDKFSHALTWMFIMQRYELLGIQHQDLQARFYGIPLDTVSYAKEKLKDYFMNRIRFAVFDMGDAMLERFLQRFKAKKIRYIYGYTNSILLFARYVIKKKLILSNMCESLRLCIVTSEVCTEEDKIELKEAFGVPVIREYGASELDVIAIENEKARWDINEANLYVEVLAEDNSPLGPGKEGRLVITSLHNKAMPFIRYDIGDVGVIEEDAQGLVLQKLSGRVNDTITLPSGKKSPGLTFYYVSRSILESTGILREFIIRQTALDSFEFDVVSDRPLTQNETEEIRNKMDVYLEPGLNFRINRVEKINRPASGKIKHFYSEINK